MRESIKPEDIMIRYKPFLKKAFLLILIVLVVIITKVPADVTSAEGFWKTVDEQEILVGYPSVLAEEPFYSPILWTCRSIAIFLWRRGSP